MGDAAQPNMYIDKMQQPFNPSTRVSHLKIAVKIKNVTLTLSVKVFLIYTNENNVYSVRFVRRMR